MDGLDVDLRRLVDALAPDHRPRFTAMVAHAVVSDHEVDVQVVSLGLRYSILVHVAAGDLLIDEETFLIAPLPRDEGLRLLLLHLRIATILDAVDRWRALHATIKRTATG